VEAKLTQEQIDEFVVACHGNFDAVKSILADQPGLINTRSSLDESPLGAAAHVGNREIAEYLVKQGAEVDLAAAAMLGDIGMVESFLQFDAAAATGAGAHGIPVIFHAVAGGNVEMVTMLLDHGASIEAIAGPNSATLNIAAARGHMEMAGWLLDHGASAVVTDFESKTALQRAEEAGHTEIVELIRSREGRA
jgi:ankyrin repeat protein